MIDVRCFSSFGDAAFLRDEVNALNRQSSRPDPFSTFEYLETFFCLDEYLPDEYGRNLWFLAAFSANRLVGYVALKQVTQQVFGAKTSTLRFLVTHDTDRPHWVVSPAFFAQVSDAFYGYVLSRKHEWSLLEWHQQDDSQLLPSALAGYQVREWPSMENCTIHVRWSTLNEYFNALARKFRANVTRQLRHLLTAGNVEWLASSDANTTPLLFELYRSIEPRSWKSQENASISRSPRRIEYCKSLLDAQQPMRVSIQILLLDGVPIAGLMTGVFLQGLYALHMVYDAEQSRLTPGSALLLMTMRQAIEGRYAFFNLLSGFKYYKIRWLATIAETRVIQIYRVGSRALWHRRLGDWQRRVLSVVLALRRFKWLQPAAGGREAMQAESDKPPTQKVDTQERERSAALIASIRKSPCEFLTTAQLVALMPFSVPLKVR